MAHFPNPLHVKVQQSGLHSLKILLIVLLIGLWIYPWSVRLKTPNIIHDDVVRIENLQTLNLASRVILPINEHLVPCLEMVTTLTWWLIGCRLALVPLGFTIASYIPFLACLAILWLLVRHETASPAAAWMAATLFAATPIYAECVYWFSASSFTWALLFTLLGFWFTRRGKGNRPPGAEPDRGRDMLFSGASELGDRCIERPSNHDSRLDSPVSAGFRACEWKGAHTTTGHGRFPGSRSLLEA